MCQKGRKHGLSNGESILIKARSAHTNSVAMLALQGVSVCVPVISFLYLANAISAEDIGRFSVIYAIGQLFIIVVDYGFNITGVRELQSRRHSSDDRAQTLISVILSKLLIGSSLILFIVALLSLSLLPEWMEALWVTVVCCALNACNPHWYCIGIRNVWVSCVIQIFTRLSGLATIFVLPNEYLSLFNIVMLHFCVFPLSGLLGAAYVYCRESAAILKAIHSRPFKEQIGGVFRRYQAGWYAFISAVTIASYTTANTAVAAIFLPVEVIAVFSVAEKVLRAFQAAWGPISNSLFPSAVELANKKNRLTRFLLQSCFVAGGVALSIAVVIALYAEQLVALFLPDTFSDAVSIIRILIFALPVSVLGSIMCILGLSALGLDKIVMKILLMSAIANVFFIALLSDIYGVTGLCIAMLVVESLVMLGAAFIYVLKTNEPKVSV